MFPPATDLNTLPVCLHFYFISPKAVTVWSCIYHANHAWERQALWKSMSLDKTEHLKVSGKIRVCLIKGGDHMVKSLLWEFCSKVDSVVEKWRGRDIWVVTSLWWVVRHHDAVVIELLRQFRFTDQQNAENEIIFVCLYKKIIISDVGSYSQIPVSRESPACEPFFPPYLTN